jgi:hypothetical protein
MDAPASTHRANVSIDAVAAKFDPTKRQGSWFASLTSLEWQLVPENLIGMGEQEPNPVRRHGNQDGRKEQTG